jgi:hypothetical protein
MLFEKNLNWFAEFEVHEGWLDCACWWADPATHPDLYAVMINGC